MRYLALLRGINVGGNNVIRMADLRACFETIGATDVTTYIQSGNVLFEGGPVHSSAWSEQIETALSEQFGYVASVVLRSDPELRSVIEHAPHGFGAAPDLHRYDVIFLKAPTLSTDAMDQLKTRDGVDVAVPGPGVVYFSRLIARVTQSQLGRVVGLPIYQQMTIRNWRTTTTLRRMLDER